MQVAQRYESSRGGAAVLTIAIYGLLFYIVAASMGIVPTPTIVKVPILANSPPEPVAPWQENKSDRKTTPVADVTKRLRLQSPPPVIGTESRGGLEKPIEIKSEEITIEPLPPLDLIKNPEPQFTPSHLVKSFEPQYPTVSLLKEEQGVVYVRATIYPSGDVGGAQIERSSGHARLDAAALKSVRLWKFAPAKRDLEAIVASQVVVVRFQLRERRLARHNANSALLHVSISG